MCIHLHDLLLVRRQLVWSSTPSNGKDRAYLRNALKTTYLLVRIPQHALPCFSASAAYFTYAITPPNPRQLGEAFLPDSTPSRLCHICFRTFCFNHPFFTENEEKRGKYPLFLSFVWIARLLFVLVDLPFFKWWVKVADDHGVEIVSGVWQEWLDWRNGDQAAARERLHRVRGRVETGEHAGCMCRIGQAEA